MSRRLSHRSLLCGLVSSFALGASARAEEAAPTEQPAPKAPEKAEFIKGELSSLGSTKLQVKDTRFGLRVGGSKIHDTYYLMASLEADLRIKSFGLGFAIPAQIPLWDPSRGGFNAFLPEGFTLRREDYDEPSEIMRLVRYVTFGKKEDNLFLNVSTESSETLGHGAAVRRYLANIDVDRGRLSAAFDAYDKYVGFESFTGDVLRPDRMLGGMAFVKPFAFSNALPLQKLSFAVSYAADLQAPFALEKDGNGLPVIDAETNTPKVAEKRAAQIVGITVETKLVKTDNVDIKPWVDVSMLVGGGAGLTVGGLGRLSFAAKHALRLILEGRAFQDNYLPSYFDTFYEVQRFQYITGAANPKTDLPKLADVLGRDASKTNLGYYAELQYAWIDTLAVTAAFEDSSAKGGRNLVLHAEVPANDFLRFFASFHRRAVEGPLLDVGRQPIGEQLAADNTLFFAGARLKLLPILYVNARAFRAWKMLPTPQSYQNVDGFQLDLEAGYEFSRD